MEPPQHSISAPGNRLISVVCRDPGAEKGLPGELSCYYGKLKCLPEKLIINFVNAYEIKES